MERSRSLPHEWEEKGDFTVATHQRGARHVRLASMFFGGAALFFFIALGIAGYLFYYGGNAVSIDKVIIGIQGPTTIAGGDIVPLSITITNKNPATLENATIEIDFPDGTRDATNVLKSYPRYIENLGQLASGATITRSVKAVIFGGAGQAITLPMVFSYSTAGSNATFEKKSPYTLAVSSTPLSVSVESLTETVSGDPFTFTLTVRSNATVPLNNVILTATSPFGFSVLSSSVPLSSGNFLIGTLAPGASKRITLTGTLAGQNGEQRVFHFTLGTAKSSQDPTLAVTYMTQDATVSIAAPFIMTTLAINGNTSGTAVVAPASAQSVSLSYVNTLPTPISNATVAITISGSAIEYDSIKAANGFYNSANHTIIFDQSTDPALTLLAPGATGIGSFTFSTLPAGVASPTVTFTISVSGTRIGQANVPEQVTASMSTTAKVATAIQLAALSSHAPGPIALSGPIPPRAEQATTYAIVWNIQNRGSVVAGGTVTATLPTYVSYTGQTTGTGSFSYDAASHTVTWNVGDIAQGGNAQGIFEVSLTPSTSQRGGMVTLVNTPSFTGYDRFAGVPVTTSATAVTTETPADPGYVSSKGIVQ